MRSIFEELQHLTSIPALSGMEDRMIAEMIQRFKPLADEVDTDRLGNVTATFRGQKSSEPTLLVFAHVDEVGLMITKIESDGYLRFDRIGGVPEKTLRGQFVNVHTIDQTAHYPAFVGTMAHQPFPMGAIPAVKAYDAANRVVATSDTWRCC